MPVLLRSERPTSSYERIATVPQRRVGVASVGPVAAIVLFRQGSCCSNFFFSASTSNTYRCLRDTCIVCGFFVFFFFFCALNLRVLIFDKCISARPFWSAKASLKEMQMLDVGEALRAPPPGAATCAKLSDATSVLPCANLRERTAV